MAFKATDQSAQLANALSGVMSIARGVKVRTQGLRDVSAAGPIPARDIATYMDTLTRASEGLDTLKVVPGLAQYAKDQYTDPGYDIAAEFLAMQNAVATTVGWVTVNLPASGQWLLLEEIVDGRLVDRTLSPLQTAPLRVELEALLVTIE